MISSSAAPMSFTTSSSHVSTQDHAHAAEGAALAPEWSDLGGAGTHVDAVCWAGGGWERKGGQHDRRPANANKEKVTGRGSARGTDTPSRPAQGHPKMPPDSRHQPYRPGPPTSRGEPPGPHGVPGAPGVPRQPRLQRPRTCQPHAPQDPRSPQNAKDLQGSQGPAPVNTPGPARSPAPRPPPRRAPRQTPSCRRMPSTSPRELTPPDRNPRLVPRRPASSSGRVA